MVADNFELQPQQPNGINLNLGERDTQAINAEATRLWARFFSSGNSSHLHVSISLDCVNFFTVPLMLPNSFLWTRQLLSSQLLPLITESCPRMVDFSVPPTCPDNNFACLSRTEEDNLTVGSAVGDSKGVTPNKKRSSKGSSALVETEIRRSPRLIGSSSGFKPNGCSDRKCLACAFKPPILKRDTIKKLASEFCKLNESELNDDLLQMKRAKTHAIARARIVPVDPAPSSAAMDRAIPEQDIEGRATEEE